MAWRPLFDPLLLPCLALFGYGKVCSEARGGGWGVIRKERPGQAYLSSGEASPQVWESDATLLNHTGFASHTASTQETLECLLSLPFSRPWFSCLHNGAADPRPARDRVEEDGKGRCMMGSGGRLVNQASESPLFPALGSFLGPHAFSFPSPTALTEPCQLPQCRHRAAGLVWRPKSLPAALRAEPDGLFDGESTPHPCTHLEQMVGD